MKDIFLFVIIIKRILGVPTLLILPNKKVLSMVIKIRSILNIQLLLKGYIKFW